MFLKYFRVLTKQSNYSKEKKEEVISPNSSSIQETFFYGG